MLTVLAEVKTTNKARHSDSQIRNMNSCIVSEFNKEGSKLRTLLFKELGLTNLSADPKTDNQLEVSFACRTSKIYEKCLEYCKRQCSISGDDWELCFKVDDQEAPNVLNSFPQQYGKIDGGHDG